MRRAAVWCLSLLALLPACGGGRSDPKQAYEIVRAAAATSDAGLYYEVHDAETRAMARRTARDWQALRARGDAPAEFLPQGMPADAIEGDLPEVAARVLRYHSPLRGQAKWYVHAIVVGEPTREGERSALLRLRGVDGRERNLWMVRETDGWTVDVARTWLQ